MSKKIIQKVCLYLLVLIFIAYNFHRYIFKYNSELTSPTYTSTPTTWKVAKYIVVFFIMLLLYTASTFKRKISLQLQILFGFVFFVLIINFLSIKYYGNINLNEVEYCVYFLIASPFCFTTNTFQDIKVNYYKIIIWFAIVLYLSNLIVIFNYLLFGRLPALAYEHGLTRFGGFWDDPNGYGFVCVFFMFIFLVKGNYWLAAISFANILLTFSFTAYFMLFACAAFWMYEKSLFLNFKVLLILLAFLLLIIWGGISNYGALIDLIDAKSGSVNDHLRNALIFNPYPLANSDIQFSETWYLSFFYNYFPVSVLGLLMFIILFLSTLKKNKNPYIRFFIFLYLFYCLFLPMYYVFPLNFIFILVLIESFKIQPKNIAF